MPVRYCFVHYIGSQQVTMHLIESELLLHVRENELLFPACLLLTPGSSARSLRTYPCLWTSCIRCRVILNVQEPSSEHPWASTLHSINEGSKTHFLTSFPMQSPGSSPTYIEFAPSFASCQVAAFPARIFSTVRTAPVCLPTTSGSWDTIFVLVKMIFE